MGGEYRSDYENSQIKAIVEWKNREPSVVSQGLGTLAAPLAWLVKKVIPESAMRAVLNGANSAGEFLADEGDIRKEAGVVSLEELRYKNLKLSDELANSVHNWAIGIAAGEGAAAGAGGVLGMAADIPAILTLALRTIHKIALCYGYKTNGEEEKIFVLKVLSLAGSNSMAEKNEALMTLKMLQVTIQRNTWKAIEKKSAEQLCKESAVAAIRSLCKQLGINFTKRKAMQAIPVIGAGVGAAVNADFLRDVGWAARRSYQQRWLVDNEKWDLG
ncbi:EcsC family protein [Selenomonas ruminantium]|uniref:EcsC family protein n=1 Tax=Selenomonas ruminantium TaxID=971 RepID=UPI0026EBBF79|nr:EcsC family protein [Selenomonas ruminantium]